MTPDISDILISDTKFKELFDAVQDCYKKVNDCNEAVYKVDEILGTAIKESHKLKLLEHYRCYK